MKSLNNYVNKSEVVLFILLHNFIFDVGTYIQLYFFDMDWHIIIII